MALALSGIPMLAFFIFTQQQWYPATYAINWLADKEGTFSLKLAVAINWALMMLPLLALLLIAIPMVAVIRRNRKKRNAAMR